jgi:hypothetical protein
MSRATLARALARLKLTVKKKSLHATERDQKRVQAERRAYLRTPVRTSGKVTGLKIGCGFRPSRRPFLTNAGPLLRLACRVCAQNIQSLALQSEDGLGNVLL